MRSPLIIPGILLAAFVIGGGLYLYGGPSFTNTLGTPSVGETNLARASFDTIALGQVAVAQDRRTNYRIKTAEEFAALWTLIYSNNGPSVPVIDFSREEVIAVFDGSHSTTGYAVAVLDVREEQGMRTIVIERTEPGDTCPVLSANESPFHIIRVPVSSLPLTKEETLTTTVCS